MFSFIFIFFRALNCTDAYDSSRLLGGDQFLVLIHPLMAMSLGWTGKYSLPQFPRHNHSEFR